MSLLVPFNGTNYLVPTIGETGWSTNVTNLLADLGNNAIPKTNPLISAGHVDGTPVGSTTPSTGAFTTLTGTTVTVPTRAPGDSTTNAASTAFATVPLLAEIARATGAENTLTTTTTTLTTASNAIITSSAANVGRNLIHNSMFRCLQRGPGPFTVAGFSADRWQISLIGSSMTTSAGSYSDANRTTIGDENAITYMTSTVVGTAGANDYSQFVQAIENSRRLSGKTVTVSFWANSTSGTPKLGIGLYQGFGTGGSPSAPVALAGQSVTISTAIVRYSVTFAVPSTSGKTFGSNGDSATQLSFWFSSGSFYATQAGSIGVQSNTFVLWGIQLEVAATATALEKPDLAVDLANCQRFYQTGQTFMTAMPTGAGQQIGYCQSFTCAMRAPPVIVLTPSLVNISALTASQIVPSSFIPNGGSVAAGFASFNSQFTASADL